MTRKIEVDVKISESDRKHLQELLDIEAKRLGYTVKTELVLPDGLKREDLDRLTGMISIFCRNTGYKNPVIGLP